MIRKFYAWVFGLLVISMSQIAWSQTGDLFTIAPSGTVGNVNVRLCLNGKGPTSCENHTVTNYLLAIRTTIPNNTYIQAGIKALESGYSFTGCTNYINGYCIFSANNTSDASVVINSATNPVTLTSVNPSSGTASGGTGITLTGANLTSATSVTFGGTNATSVNVVNSTTVTAVTPSNAIGAVDVVITTPHGSDTLTNGYTYYALSVGQSSSGGVIACLNGALNNLIAATVDNSTGIQWGGLAIAVGIAAQSNIDGASNTAAIVAALVANSGIPYAAQLCNDYEVDSQGNTPCQSGNACYSDWFLPAGNSAALSGQINCLYTNRVAVGGFSAANYWSSTEYTTDPTASVWAQSFSSGSQFGDIKSGSLRVRCVRAFTP